MINTIKDVFAINPL